MILSKGRKHLIHDNMVMAREMRDADTRGACQRQRGIFGSGLGVKAKQHFGAAIGLDPGNGDGVIDLRTGRHQHAEPAAIDRAHRRA